MSPSAAVPMSESHAHRARVRSARHPVLGVLAATTAACVLLASAGEAQAQRPRLPAGPPLPAQKAALIDLTGYWVAIVDQDWRWRMLTAPVGDVSSIPVNAAGRKAAREWN